MRAKSFEPSRAGSPEKTSRSSQRQVGLSTVGQQIVVGLLTRKQVAARLQTCVHTVARYTKRGLLPAVMVGHRLIRYKAEDVQRFIDSAVVEKEVAP